MALLTNGRPHHHVCYHKIVCVGDTYLDCTTPTPEEAAHIDFAKENKWPIPDFCPVQDEEINEQGEVKGFCQRCRRNVSALTIREQHTHECSYAAYCVAPTNHGLSVGAVVDEETYKSWKYLRTCYHIETAEDFRQTRGLTICDNLVGSARTDYDLCGACSSHYWS